MPDPIRNVDLDPVEPWMIRNAVDFLTTFIERYQFPMPSDFLSPEVVGTVEPLLEVPTSVPETVAVKPKVLLIVNDRTVLSLNCSCIKRMDNISAFITSGVDIIRED